MAASLPLVDSTSARAVMVYLADDVVTAFVIAAAFACDADDPTGRQAHGPQQRAVGFGDGIEPRSEGEAHAGRLPGRR